jgi:hypothetical protein
MGGAVDHILNVDQGWLYLIVFGLVFAEDALFFGFVIPGETAAVLAGVQAWRGHAHLSAVMIVVVLAAITGDSVGFEVGATTNSGWNRPAASSPAAADWPCSWAASWRSSGPPCRRWPASPTCPTGSSCSSTPSAASSGA